jgi:hypothetical protein
VGSNPTPRTKINHENSVPSWLTLNSNYRENEGGIKQTIINGVTFLFFLHVSSFLLCSFFLMKAYVHLLKMMAAISISVDAFKT